MMHSGSSMCETDRRSWLACLADSSKPQLEIILQRILEKFCRNETEEEMYLPQAFPRGLNDLVKNVAAGMGLQTSVIRDPFGKPQIVVQKVEMEEKLPLTTLELKQSSIQAIETLKTSGILQRNEHNVEGKKHFDFSRSFAGDELNRSAGRLLVGRPNVPPRSRCPENILRNAVHLPIWEKRSEILHYINNHQVVIVAGSPGTGKTTQIPYFILEHCSQYSLPCRVVSAQPWRIGAVSAAEKVASQRGEKVGSVVCLQTRLDSRTSPCGLLTFATTGVLVRSLVNSDNMLSSLTHVIIDEVHERDRYNDMLLTFLKLQLRNLPHLRVILLMADVNVQGFRNYFQNCPAVELKPPLPVAKKHFLENVLQMTGFMEQYKMKMSTDEGQNPQENFGQEIVDKAVQPEFTSLFDKLLEEAALKHDETALEKLLQLAESGEMAVDYRHSKTGITLLTAAAFIGDLESVLHAVYLGADPAAQANGGEYTAADIARSLGHENVAELLDGIAKIFKTEIRGEDSSESLPRNWRVALHSIEQQKQKFHYNPQIKEYFHYFSEEIVNLDLICHLIGYIDQHLGPGTILVFLPGYDEILNLSLILRSSHPLATHWKIHTLHSLISLAELNLILEPTKPGTRKIILAASFVESGVNFEDLVYVIDSGRIRERSGDSIVSFSTQWSSWISKSSAALRAGKILQKSNGTYGEIFHLFSAAQYHVMTDLPIPEINRVPVQDLHLCVSRLVPMTTISANRFFALMMDPPAQPAVHAAQHVLETLEAIDCNGTVTEIGKRLNDLPLEPRLGKILMVAIILKCVDPVLTIISCLACGCPFIIPTQAEKRGRALKCKTLLSEGTCSDLIALLQAYQQWEKASEERKEQQFCNENFLSMATMRLISTLRSQLVGELRVCGLVRVRGNSDMSNMNIHSNSWVAVKGSLTAGLFPNIGRFVASTKMVTTHDEFKSMFHMSSVLWNDYQWKQGSFGNFQRSAVPSVLHSCPWILFETMQRTGPHFFLHSCTVINPLVALLFGGNINSPDCSIRKLPSEEESFTSGFQTVREAGNFHGNVPGLNSGADIKAPRVMLAFTKLLTFKTDIVTANCLQWLRRELQSFIRKRLTDPGKMCNDEPILRTVLSILAAEDFEIKASQPSTLGRRPRIVSGDAVSRQQSTVISETEFQILEGNYIKNLTIGGSF